MALAFGFFKFVDQMQCSADEKKAEQLVVGIGLPILESLVLGARRRDAALDTDRLIAMQWQVHGVAPFGIVLPLAPAVLFEITRVCKINPKSVHIVSRASVPGAMLVRE